MPLPLRCEVPFKEDPPAAEERSSSRGTETSWCSFLVVVHSSRSLQNQSLAQNTVTRSCISSPTLTQPLIHNTTSQYTTPPKMKQTTSLLLAAATLAAAADPVVVKILMPMADPQHLGASVISAGASATSYFVSCPTGTPADECGFAEGIKVLYGPSTMAYDMSYTAVDESSSIT